MKAGLKSPSHLKSVIDNKRNLTDNTISKYIVALNFSNSKEASYFKLLVKYNQEESLEKKEGYFELLMEEKRKKGLTLIELAQYNFLANWHNVALYVLLDMANYTLNDTKLLKIFSGKISSVDLEESFSTLIVLNLIKENEEGFYKQTNGAISTLDEVKSMAARKYHKKMNELANLSLDDDKLEKREFNGVTLPINFKKIPLIKEKIRKFRKEINALASAYSDPTHVYQLNIQLFPLTEDLE